MMTAMITLLQETSDWDTVLLIDCCHEQSSKESIAVDQKQMNQYRLL